MGPVDDKRATQFIADKIPLLEQPPPDTVTTMPLLPVPRHKPKETIPSSVRLAKRSIVSSPAEPSYKIIQGQPQGLALPEATRLSGNNVGSNLDTFKKFYKCDLAGTVTIYVRCFGCRVVWAIHQYSYKDTNKILKTLHKFHPLMLDHLTAILSQVISSLMLIYLSYLVSHTSLDCSSILMSLEGEIQIVDLASIARVIIQLIQKYTKNDGTVGINNLDHWRKFPAAIEFLSATTSAGSFEELKKHLLSEVRWSPSDLIGIAWFALISARTFYSYTPLSDAET
ncbi:hypothetical protein BO94DRAFT_559572 [Aspergillus sclerotioniger CBS 115572]|uniref:Uncharacterized protein n=1 Tax=Aspergillus sclerotioniger CBS 115572 TaxID=1450535 RepID=A0A317VNW9_9EURO|nr:hypothetical protein BO94DRAFT_559572 [Aspergillus sclerotioniger CBS 115572]PWY75289.1 hypothetical protein BO94DRAFT_559572 [Aspergillus sclerotioniger CBS 115572]